MFTTLHILQLFTLGRDVMHRTSRSTVVCRKRRERELLTHSMTLSKKKNELNSAQRLSTHELIIVQLTGARQNADQHQTFEEHFYGAIGLHRVSNLRKRQQVHSHSSKMYNITRDIFLRVFYHSTAKIIHLIHFTNFSSTGRTFFSFFSADRISRSLG